MKTIFESHSTRIVLSISTILFLAGISESGAGAAAPAPAIQSAEKTSFYEVTAHLDPGGSLYGYLSTSQWLDGLSQKVEGWRGAVLAWPGIEGDNREKVSQAFGLLTQVIASSGLERVSGVGISGIALEPGYYQTKVLIHRHPAEDPGYLWTLAGAAPRPLNELDWLPLDTAWATFGDFDLGEAWKILAREVERSGLSDAIEGLALLDKRVEAATGKPLSELLGSLGGEQGAALILHGTRTIALPLPVEVRIPEPGLLLAVKVKDDTVFDLIDGALKPLPQVIRIDSDGLRSRTMPVPVPLPMTVRPTVARYGDYLLVASSDEIIARVVDIQAGRTPGLKASPEFQRLAREMPSEGNQFTFVSERLGRVVGEVQQAAFQMAARSEDASQPPVELLRKLYAGSLATSSYTVSSQTREGWLIIGRGNQEPAKLLTASLVVAPVAIVAGITLPAFAKAKARAQSLSCVNQLKSLGVAARIWSGDNDGVLPADFLAMKADLGTPRILFCPADKGAPKSDTWEDLDVALITYEFVAPGAREDAPGFYEQVVFRCPIHDHAVMGGGEVRPGD